MSSVSALYAPLIERDLAAIRGAVAEFRKSNAPEELFLAVARFAVLAFAPSEHSKHALLAALAAHDVREQYADRWDDLLIECARYAAVARQPWSEPPLMDPPAVDEGQPTDVGALRSAIAAQDRLAGERWLAARLDDDTLERDLVDVACDDLDDFGTTLVVTAAAIRLAGLLGEKGRFAVHRIAVWQMTAAGARESQPVGTVSVESQDLLARLIAASVAEGGSIESVHRVILFDAAVQSGADRVLSQLAAMPLPSAAVAEEHGPPLPVIYPLARDYGQALIARGVAARLRTRFPSARLDAFVAAADSNREHGESFDEFSLA